MTEWAQASHIVGGNFELLANGTTPGSYTLNLSMFFDENFGSQNAVTNTITVSIFRKRNNERMQDVVMTLQSRTSVNYANQACATARSLRTTDIRYTARLSLTNAYDDEQGYYVVWERCCRNNSVDNILRPGQVGMTFYLEFPPVQYLNQPLLNSSPVFAFPNGEYICRNQPFQLNFSATDADGDLLRYSLVTPYIGNATANNPNANNVGSSSYPEVQWAPGFSEGIQIQGAPPLTVGRGNGLLTVTASTLGLHVFCVLVEEYRSGRRIGAVRRDFQLLVIDCPKEAPPKPTVFTATQPGGTSTASFCEGSFVELKTEASSEYNYQWQRNGDNVLGATAPTIRVMEAGEYIVVKSYAQKCGQNIKSDVIVVTKRPAQPAEIKASGPTAFCEGGTVTLQATTGGNLGYLWLRNGTDTLKTATTPTLTVNQTGAYQVWITNRTTECQVLAAAVDVVVNKRPAVKLINERNKTVFCDGDTLPLRTTVTGTAGMVFQWHRNGPTIAGATLGRYPAVQAGQFWTVVTDANKCTSTSDTLALTLNPRPVVTMDTIQPLCSTKAQTVTLAGTPAGGVFAGRGVSGNLFNPLAAGLGAFPLTYTVTNQFQCSTTARRIALVTQAPRVQLGPDVSIVEGDSVKLLAQVTQGAQYGWSPPTALSSADELRPLAFPTQTTTYWLTATLANGCVNAEDIVVTVYPKLTVPQGITPNGDGANDVWELPGIDRYPEAEVKIFNRWGSEVFSSKGYTLPFDGTQNGRKLPVATYYYVILPNNGRPALKGTLTIIN
jgi:gliding motility-associated-like protein